MPATKTKGFTLLEILVAVFIIGIIAIIMVRGLQTVITAKHGLERNSRRLTDVALSLTLLGNDLKNIVNRPILEANANQLPALILQNDGRQTLEFTRGAVANPLAAHRSTLLRVAYQLSNDKFIRLTWPVLDRTAATKPSERVLLKNVSHLQWQFWGSDNRYYSSWPAANTAIAVLPKAIKVSLTIKKWGVITRIWLLNNKVVETKQNNSNSKRTAP